MNPKTPSNLLFEEYPKTQGREDFVYEEPLAGRLGSPTINCCVRPARRESLIGPLMSPSISLMLPILGREVFRPSSWQTFHIRESSLTTPEVDCNPPSQQPKPHGAQAGSRATKAPSGARAPLTPTSTVLQSTAMAGAGARS